MGEDYYEISKFGEAQSAINADKNDRFPVAHSLAGSALPQRKLCNRHASNCSW